MIDLFYNFISFISSLTTLTAKERATYIQDSNGKRIQQRKYKIRLGDMARVLSEIRAAYNRIQRHAIRVRAGQGQVLHML